MFLRRSLAPRTNGRNEGRCMHGSTRLDFHSANTPTGHYLSHNSRRSKPAAPRAGHDPVNTRYAAMNEWKPVSRVAMSPQSAPGQRRNKTGLFVVFRRTVAVANSSELRDSGLVSRSSYPRDVISRHGRREITAQHLFIAYRVESPVNHLALADLSSSVPSS